MSEKMRGANSNEFSIETAGAGDLQKWKNAQEENLRMISYKWEKIPEVAALDLVPQLQASFDSLSEAMDAYYATATTDEEDVLTANLERFREAAQAYADKKREVAGIVQPVFDELGKKMAAAMTEALYGKDE
jgi:hypothetical protein